MNPPEGEESNQPQVPKVSDRTQFFGIALLVAAVLFWVAAPAVVFTPLSAGQKIWASSAFLVLGEVAFWVAALALGREMIRRHRRFLDPRDWFGEGRR